MTNRTKYNKEIIRTLLEYAATQGYKCYETQSKFYAYGWLITPNGNILYVQPGDYYGGYRFSLKYKPRKDTGSGCSCNNYDEPLYKVTLETLQQIEQAGLNFANELKATLYTKQEVKDFFKNYWNKDNIKEITSELTTEQQDKAINIINQQGGCREKNILENAYIMERSETWNNEHKVINILNAIPDSNGHNDGCKIDIEQNRIVG